MEEIQISIAHNQEEIFRLIRLREEVFVIEQSVPLRVELDEEDDRATHLVAKAGREVVGTARLVVKGSRGKIGRMAVRKGWRRKRIGERLVIALIPLARERGVTELVLHAQLHAVPFYERQGFQAEGSPFEEAGIPHISMRRSVETG